MRRFLVIAAAGLLVSACGLPFGIGQASTSQLINGAADNLSKAKGFELAGKFTSGSDKYTVDLKYESSGAADMALTKGDTHLELLQINGKAYYKGKDFIASVAGSDAFGQALARAVGDKWFTSKDATPMDLSGFTDATKVKANFLNTFNVNRKDNVSVNGQDTAELSDSNTILNITESSPYELVRIRTQPSKSVQDLSDVDFVFSNYNKDFGISQPTDVWQMDDPSTWPPFYVVTAINLNRCDNDPCTVQATVQNNGGTGSASGASSVTFTLTNDADNSVLGTCKANVSPDVANGKTASVSCQITGGAWTAFVQNGGNYHAKADTDNPAYD